MEYLSAKHLVIRSKSADWFGTDHTMNIYRGCCHGCIYCDSRSDCYRNPDFDTVKVKKDALRIIRDDLRRKVKPGIVGTGAMSDPYNPFEQELCLTRNALSLLDAYNFGVAIATKSDLIARDIDVLKCIQEHSPVLCKLTVTTMDEALAARLEPGAPTPARRMAAAKALADAGIPVCILLMPVLPFLEDSDESVLAVVDAAAEAGARYLYPAFGVTQRAGQREWFHQKLQELFPDRGLAERYRKAFGENYVCTSPNAKGLWGKFSRRCGEKGLLYEMKHITANYQRGYAERQLTFF